MIIIDDFHHVNFIFSQKFHFLYFEDYLMMKLNKGVCVTLTMALAIYITKYLQKAKEEEELWKLKYFTMQKL
jgi:hypothetical protein